MKFLFRYPNHRILLAGILISGPMAWLIVRMASGEPYLWTTDPRIPPVWSAIPRRAQDEVPVGSRGEIEIAARTQVAHTDRKPTLQEVQAGHDPAVLLSGRVLDSRGQPVAGARVRLATIPEEEFEDEEPEVAEVRRTRTRKDGRFSFCGEALAANYRLTACAPGLQRAVLRCEGGRTNVAVRLEAAALVAGTLLIDPEIPVRRLEALLRSGERYFRLPLTGCGGVYTIRQDHLPPGPASFCLRSLFDRRIFRIKEFELAAGTNSTPTELLPLDLRGALRCFRIRTLGPNGEALTAAVSHDMVAVRSKAPIDVVTRSVLSNLTVRADGYRPVNIPRLDDDKEIRLQKGIPLRIEVDPVFARWGGMTLGLVLEPNGAHVSGSSTPFPKSTYGDFSEDGRAKVVLGEAGEHRLRLYISRGLSDVRGGEVWSCADVEANLIRVADDPGLQVFRPWVGVDALNRAARSLTD